MFMLSYILYILTWNMGMPKCFDSVYVVAVSARCEKSVKYLFRDVLIEGC